MNDFPVLLGQTTQSWLNANGFKHIVETRQISDNPSTPSYLITNHRQEKIVAKISSLNNDALEKEADGLTLIANTQSIRTPEVLDVNPQCLLIEYIAESRQRKDYWAVLASEVAQLHQYHLSHSGFETRPAHHVFGLEYNNYCGASLQVNGWFDNGHEFFCDQRLLYQARLAFDNGYLESPWVILIESICERLTELIPVQPASLLHGDLWSGNILVDENGEPALIDPAAHYGWREADIAMTLLFGGLPHEFYVTYDEEWPMETHWRARVPLYNLYHLLNHLNIFGVSYLEQVQTTISRYA